MRYNVVILRADGSAEVLAAEVDGDRADEILSHPSVPFPGPNYNGDRAVMLASWDVPAILANGAAR